MISAKYINKERGGKGIDFNRDTTHTCSLLKRVLVCIRLSLNHKFQVFATNDN